MSRGQEDRTLKEKKALKTANKLEKRPGLLFVPSLAIGNAKENFYVCENCAGLILASGKIEYFLGYTWKSRTFSGVCLKMSHKIDQGERRVLNILKLFAQIWSTGMMPKVPN